MFYHCRTHTGEGGLFSVTTELSPADLAVWAQLFEFTDQTNTTLSPEIVWLNARCESRYSPCSCTFVVCRRDRIVQLVLAGDFGPFPTIPEAVGLFTGLEVLDLSDSSLAGPIPESLQNAVNLIELDLSGSTNMMQMCVRFCTDSELAFFDSRHSKCCLFI